jgi:hypothetical protein
MASRRLLPSLLACGAAVRGGPGALLAGVLPPSCVAAGGGALCMQMRW